ncbi:tetratricopeptide repeat protein, partial [Brachyspira hampsonii]|uniref:tetratricopeptide repeat protein n=1 Tax=Brachyspira hampsonii TaxID=1287055 RepID=UPI0002ADE88B
MISEENKYFYSALNNIQNKKYDEAIDDLIKIIEIDPHNLDAYHNLARVYYDMENYDKAIDTYNKSIEIYPHDSDTYYYRAESYLNKKDYDKAIEDLRKSILKMKRILM